MSATSKRYVIISVITIPTDVPAACAFLIATIYLKNHYYTDSHANPRLFYHYSPYLLPLPLLLPYFYHSPSINPASLKPYSQHP